MDNPTNQCLFLASPRQFTILLFKVARPFKKMSTKDFIVQLRKDHENKTTYHSDVRPATIPRMITENQKTRFQYQFGCSIAVGHEAGILLCRNDIFDNY